MSCENHIKTAKRKESAGVLYQSVDENLIKTEEFKDFLQEVLKTRVPDIVFRVSRVLKEEGASGVDIVGGFNRDLIQEFINAKQDDRKPNPRKIDNGDFDVEVGGLKMNDLVKILKTKINPPFIKVIDSDAEFFVVKCYYTPRDYLDISLRRKEQYKSKLTCTKCHSKFDYNNVSYEDRLIKRCPVCKNKNVLFDMGSRDEFDTISDLNISRREAAKRRDFTWNALMLSMPDGEMIDEWGGIRDLINKQVNWITKETFTQDPLRFVRAAYFASKDPLMIISPELKKCAKEFQYRKKFLNQTKLFEVYEKMVDKGIYFIEAFDYLTRSGWIHVKDRKTFMKNVHFLQLHLLKNHGQKIKIDSPRVKLSKSQQDLYQKRRYAAYLFAILMANEPDESFREFGKFDEKIEDAAILLMRAIREPVLSKENIFQFYPLSPYGFTIKDIIQAREILGKPSLSKDTVEFLQKNNWEKPQKVLRGNKIRQILEENHIVLNKNNITLLSKLDKFIYNKQLQGEIVSEDEAEKLLLTKIKEIKGDV